MLKHHSLALSFCLLLTSCTFIQRTGPVPAPQTASGSNSVAVAPVQNFFQNGRYAIMSVQPDGSDLREVASSARQRKQISVSPDAREILYVEYTDDLNKDGLANAADQLSAKVGLMSLDGSNPQLLINTESAQVSPSFSPDGKFIIFAGLDLVGQRYLNFDLFRLRRGEKFPEQLTQSLYWAETDPAWVGNTLSFSSFQINKTLSFTKIVLSDEEFDKDSILTDPNIQNATDTNPAKHFGDYDSQFSPDGQWIAFTRYLDNDFAWRGQTVGDYDIYLSDLKGNNLLNISNNPEPDFEPAFSPDSQSLAFTKLGNKDSLIMLYDLKKQESKPLVLPDLKALVSDPTFAPNGRIYFTAEKLF